MVENNDTTNVENEIEEPLKEGEIRTEVTSIAKEEEKTGQKIEIPSAEEIVRRASVSLMNCRRQLAYLAGNMSRKSLVRAINASFDLPQDNMPVMLKQEEEKQFFAIAQRAQSDKFILIQHHIYQETKRRKEEEELVKKLEEQKANEVPNTTETSSVETTITNNEQGVN